jgi:hypothetical protein
MKGIEQYGCTYHGPDHQHHDRAARDRGSLWGHHRPGLSRHSGKVHHRPRAGFGQVVRRGAATSLVVAALLLLSVPLSASAASDGFTNPLPNSDAIPSSGLPDCTLAEIKTGTSGVGLAAAAQLGWKLSPRIAVTHGGETAEVVPSLPCRSGQNLSVTLAQSALVGQPDFRGDAGFQVTFSCYVGGAVVKVDGNGGAPGPITFGYGAGTGIKPMVSSSPSSDAGSTLSTCPQIVGVQIQMYTVPEAWPGSYVYTPSVTWYWTARSWTTTTGGWTPATSVNGILPAGVELPIVCVIDTSGADIFAITQHYWASLANWVPCMTIPVGWDRANRIGTSWSTGPIGDLTNAYRVAVPSGIACGAVAPISFYSVTVGLDTCAGDFAPGWVKTVLGWVIVLGTSALIVRRIFWSVGSRA